MSEQQSEPRGNGGGMGNRMVVLLSAAVIVLLGVTAFLYFFYYSMKAGVEQPIPFSHRVHAGDKQIGCLMCHYQASTTERAGMPPVATCMICHEHIITTYPPIKELKEHYENNTPVVWNRVYALREFVYFNHQVHINRGIDCGHCHGDVKAMDRLQDVNNLTSAGMGFCVQCHRDNGVSHDCWVCHR